MEHNLYAYCLNNPVNLKDEDGELPKWAKKLLIGATVIAVAATVTVVTGGAGAGVAGCIVAGALKGAAIGAISGGIMGAGTGAIGHRISTGSWKGAGKTALESGADGFMAGAITGGGGRAVQAVRNTKVTSSSLPKTGRKMSSVSQIRDGKVAQRRFYGITKKARFDLDYLKKPQKGHSMIHGHRVNFSKRNPRSKQINNIWWRRKK